MLRFRGRVRWHHGNGLAMKVLKVSLEIDLGFVCIELLESYLCLIVASDDLVVCDLQM